MEEKRERMQRYFTLLRVLGADDAKLIEPSSVATAPWPAFKCQYGCGTYGKSYCCPPHTPAHDRMRGIIDSYETAILFHFKRMGNLTEVAQKTARQMFLDGYYKAIALGSGPCRLCAVCALTETDAAGKPAACRFPEKAIPAMEACGIDVYATARANGFEIATLSDKDQPKNFYGLLLVE